MSGVVRGRGRGRDGGRGGGGGRGWCVRILGSGGCTVAAAVPCGSFRCGALQSVSTADCRSASAFYSPTTGLRRGGKVPARLHLKGVLASHNPCIALPARRARGQWENGVCTRAPRHPTQPPPPSTRRVCSLSLRQAARVMPPPEMRAAPAAPRVVPPAPHPTMKEGGGAGERDPSPPSQGGPGCTPPTLAVPLAVAPRRRN